MGERVNANFPRLRRAALEAVNKCLATQGPPASLRAAWATHAGLLASREVHSFLLPENGEVLSFDSPVSVQVKDCHLPFESVAIEYEASDSWIRDTVARSPTSDLPAIATVILAVQTMEEISIFCVWKFQHGGKMFWSPSPVGFRLSANSELSVERGGYVRASNITSLVAHQTVQVSDSEMTNFIDEIRVLAHFLLLTNCTNVRPQPLFVPSAALVKRANERGNLPPDEYWTLDCLLGEVEERAPDKGGSHAPPRFHVRRGHVRRLPSGVLTWVRQCTVGDASLGTVQKAYRVKESKTCQA